MVKRVDTRTLDQMASGSVRDDQRANARDLMNAVIPSDIGPETDEPRTRELALILGNIMNDAWKAVDPKGQKGWRYHMNMSFRDVPANAAGYIFLGENMLTFVNPVLLKVDPAEWPRMEFSCNDPITEDVFVETTTPRSLYATVQTFYEWAVHCVDQRETDENGIWRRKNG